MIKKKFNDGWIYRNGSGSALAALFGGEEESVPVTLPHDAVIGSQRVADDPSYMGTGCYKAGNVNYTKYFSLDSSDIKKVVWLEFEGVYQNAAVYINNSFAGKCPYGYGNFYIDATPYVRYDQKNQIKVLVKNGSPSGRWYTGGGIYRDVNIMIANRLHVDNDGVKIDTLDIEEDYSVIRVTTQLINQDAEVYDAVVCTEILDASGIVVANDTTPITMLHSSARFISQQLIIDNARLWDTDHPYLYQCRTSVLVHHAIVDETLSSFGVRELQLDARKGLRINGKTVKLRGGCIHHDSGLIGAATFVRAEERRVQMMKDAGYNALRSAHHPMGRSLLDACDRLGMLVMDEFSDAWTTTKVDFDYGLSFSEWWEHDVTNMVNKAYNHPCVIMYSIGNEIQETGNKFDVTWGKKIADKIRSLDSTRPLTNAVNFLLSIMTHMNEMAAEMGLTEVDNNESKEINTLMASKTDVLHKLLDSDQTGDITAQAFSQVDVAGYNYAAFRYEKDLTRYPTRIIVGSETTCPDLDFNWSLVEKHPAIIGDFCWTSWEYLGESGISRITYNDEKSLGFYAGYPWRMANCSDFDLIGKRRPVSYWRQIIWGRRKDPYIAVQDPSHYGDLVHFSQWGFTDAVSNWNWAGYEGRPVVVEVYADADEVELFVNSHSVGRKRVGENKKCIAKFDIVYEPGEIESIAYLAGEVSGRYSLRSATDMACINLNVEQKTIMAGCSDLAYIQINVTDTNGVLHPQADCQIQVKVEGPGTLIGLGSADPKSEGNYTDSTCNLFEGRALAIVRSSDDIGTIKVSVSAKGYKTQTAQISVN